MNPVLNIACNGILGQSEVFYSTMTLYTSNELCTAPSRQCTGMVHGTRGGFGTTV